MIENFRFWLVYVLLTAGMAVFDAIRHKHVWAIAMAGCAVAGLIIARIEYRRREMGKPAERPKAK